MIKFELPRIAHIVFFREAFTINDAEAFLDPVSKMRNPIYTFVDYYGERPVSMCRCMLLGDTLLITYLLVDKRYRGLRMGRDMLLYVKQFAKENKIRVLTANTRVSNTSMRALLTRNRFEEELNGKYNNGETKIKYTCRL